jgi:AraC-like DNA-binding protein
MLRKVKNAFVPDPAVMEMRQTLARRITAITGRAGEHSTAIPDVWLYQRTTPTPCYRASYEPGLSVFVQGRKRIILGGTEYVCDGSSFLLSSIDVPAQSQIIEASPKTPLLTMFIKLDMPTVREVVSRDDMLTDKPVPHRQGLAVGETTVGLLGTCLRLLDLLETPEDIPFLNPLIQREILYRILKTPQGERLRAIATNGDLSQRTARARMGVSTLHHQFRALTAMSPLQYQKQIRLQTARQRMLMDGLDATTAAYEVGYESVSQFSREYGRFFGLPPIRDIKSLRESNVTQVEIA